MNGEVFPHPGDCLRLDGTLQRGRMSDQVALAIVTGIVTIALALISRLPLLGEAAPKNGPSPAELAAMRLPACDLPHD